MDNNVNGTKHKRNISRRLHFVKYGENYKMDKIDWCEVGLQLSDFVTKNVGENDLNPKKKYIMGSMDN